MFLVRSGLLMRMAPNLASMMPTVLAQQTEQAFL